MQSREFKVYCLYNKSTDCIFYVGSTYRQLEERFADHKKPSNNSFCGKYIKKIGKDNIDVALLEVCDCIDDMFDREYYWTKYYSEFFELKNLDFGKMHGESFFSKVRGSNHHFYGKHHSEETKEKIRAWTLAHPNSRESIIKGALALTGRKHSEEWSNNIKHGLRELYSSGYKNNNCIKVQLVNTGEVFDSLKDAGLAYNVASTHIVACCKGKRKSAGKLNGVKMVWKYV